VKCGDARIINNLAYNWNWWPTGISGGVKTDIIGNFYKPGPDTPENRLYEVMVRKDWESPAYGPKGNPSIYIKGNIGPHQKDPEGDNWIMMMENVRWQPIGHAPDRKISERTEPFNTDYFPITIHSVIEIEKIVFKDVGACRTLNENGEWISVRDVVDNRLIKEFRSGTGKIIVDENDVGGFPEIKKGIRYPDDDHDGMSDTWERKNTLDTDNPDGSNDKDRDGYTNIEEFLNGTNPNVDEKISVVKENNTLNPLVFHLSPNYPNPFNPATTIEYSIPLDGHVTLAIYNASGQTVGVLKDDDYQTAGYYSITWNAANMPSGLYFCTLKANGFTETRKMALVK